MIGARLDPTSLRQAEVAASSKVKSPKQRGWYGARAVEIASRVCNAIRLRKLGSHRHKIACADRVLRIIGGFRGEAVGARVFTYLRKVDPSVFEEMVLSSLQGGGRLVLRNTRYTGDGGSDGRFYEPGVGWFQVQSKRYGKHISAEHVREFERLIESTGCVGGLFVHTGKTGAAAWVPAAGEGSRIIMVSGRALLGLLLSGEIP